jgi:DNA invertase Pin-like site-specific DNA recombinase
MFRKAGKRRPTKVQVALSDATSHNVPDTNGTKRRTAMIVGYGRTNTTDQTAGLAGQARDLEGAGAPKIFTEQVSSVAQRARLTECLAFLRDGDVLMVTKPDRLARSTAELLAIEADLSKRKIGLVILSMGGERLDTRNSTSKLMLTILAGVATWEREIMLERQREGIAKAPRQRPRESIRAAHRPSQRRPSRYAPCEPRASVRPISLASLGLPGAPSIGCLTCPPTRSTHAFSAPVDGHFRRTLTERKRLSDGQ